MPAPPTSAPPVLLVHGLGGSAARTWADNGWLDLLADIGRATIAPDLLGHGTAPRPHEPDAYLDLENNVLEAIADHPVVDVISFSLGAKICLTLAGEHPDRFRRVVVAGVGANLFRDDDSRPLAEALRSPDLHEHPLARYFQQLAVSTGADPLAMAALLDRPGERRFTAEVAGRITAPVLVVLGSNDFAGPADPLVEALAHPTLVTLPNVDHFATPKNFGFIDAALDFLAAPDPDAP